MRKYWILAAVVAAILPTTRGASFADDDFKSPAPKTVKTSDGRELSLVWSDEFNGEGAPDPDAWSYEIGFVRNNEEQYYVDGRPENIFQKDGLLTIRTLKEDYDVSDKPNNKGRKIAKYTSAAIETLGKKSWRYGRVEVRAKLPQGKGIWPAIWMMGDDISSVGWPSCGEIDIMEYVGHTPRTSHATIHMHRKGGKNWETASKGKNIRFDEAGQAPEERFCVYALEWTKDKLLLFVDDNLVLDFERSEEESKTDKWPFDQKCFIILNTAIGGSWGGEIADDTCPAEFLIDYVRVYQ